MAQLYAQQASTPGPFVLTRTSAGLCTLRLAAPLIVTYSGGGTDTIAAGSVATVSGGSATTFDASSDVYVAHTVQGSGTLEVVKEAELATLASNYAPLARIVQHEVAPYQPDQYLGASASASAASDITARCQVISAGADPDALYPGWHAPDFDDSAWASAVATTPNSGEESLVPDGAIALWSKASGAPYQLSGAAIGSFSVPVTSSTGGAPSWTLTIGNLYALETSGGPFYEDLSLTPTYTTLQYSQDGGTTWHCLTADVPNSLVPTDSWETTTDANHFRVYFAATATSLRVRVLDSFWGDNSGSISVTLSPAEAIECLLRSSVSSPIGSVSIVEQRSAFDSAGTLWLNGTLIASDADSSAAGPQLHSFPSASTVLAGANVLAAHVRGAGGSSPDKGWGAYALSVSYVGAGSVALPVASTDQQGIVQVGSGLSVSGGVVRGGPSAHLHAHKHFL